MSSTHGASSTVTRVLVRWTESSLMVTTTWLTVEVPWSSFLLRCTENSWKAPWQSDTRLYSHVPGNWNTSPSNVLKCWLPQVLQMLLTWFRTRKKIGERIQIVKSSKDFFFYMHLFIFPECNRELLIWKTRGQFLTQPGLDFDEKQ